MNPLKLKLNIASVMITLLVIQAVIGLTGDALALGVPYPVMGQVTLDGLPADGASVTLIDANTGSMLIDTVGPTGASLTSGWYSFDMQNLAIPGANGHLINIVATTAGLTGTSSFIYDSALAASNPAVISLITPPATTHTITSSAGANGTISPLGANIVNAGASSTFTITPNATFNVLNVLVDGISVGAVNSYTFMNVIANHTISATFTSNPITTYAITSTAGTNGSISPLGTTLVNSGASQTYTITPNAGFNIYNVLVDGIVVGAFGTYTFTSVLATHTITANFVAAPIATYSVISSAGANGAIAPLGVATLNAGSNQIYSIFPNPGYQVQELLVDGVPACGTSNYTFTNITANHTISASFSLLGTFTAPSCPTGTSTQTSVTLNWTGSAGGTLPINYSVLRNGVSVGATTSTTYTDSGLTASTSPVSYSYMIRATDSTAPTAHTGTTTALAISTLPIPTTTIPMTLNAGWNLVTLPAQPIDANKQPINYTAETFGQLAGADMITSWVPASQSYSSHIVGFALNNFNLANGMGFFVHRATSTVINLTTIPPSSPAPVVSAGWNLLGWTSSATTTANLYGLSITGADLVTKWDGISQLWSSHIVNFALNDFTISQGDGIFVHKP